jgi:hypothetical protein
MLLLESILHFFIAFEVSCHHKIPSVLGTSENRLGPNLDCIVDDLHEHYA